MEFNKSPFFGKLVEFTSGGRTFRGTVVKTVIYAHCANANTYTVHVADRSSNGLYQLSMGFKVVGEGDVDAARADYTEMLSQYPAWRENFARGISVGW